MLTIESEWLSSTETWPKSSRAAKPVNTDTVLLRYDCGKRIFRAPRLISGLDRPGGPLKEHVTAGYRIWNYRLGSARTSGPRLCTSSWLNAAKIKPHSVLALSNLIPPGALLVNQFWKLWDLRFYFSKGCVCPWGEAKACQVMPSPTFQISGPTLRRKVVDRCRALWAGHPGRGAALMKCGWMKRFENEYRERSRNLP